MRMALAFQLIESHQLYTAVTGVVLINSAAVLLAETDKMIEQFGGDKNLTCAELVDHVEQSLAKTTELLASGELSGGREETARFYHELAEQLLAAEKTTISSKELNSVLAEFFESSSRGSRGETLSYLTEEIGNDARRVRPAYEKYREQLKAQYPKGADVPLINCLDARIEHDSLGSTLLTAMLANEVVSGVAYSAEVVAELRNQLIPSKQDDPMAFLAFMLAGGATSETLLEQFTNA